MIVQTLVLTEFITEVERHKESCMFVQKLPQTKEALERTYIKGEVEKRNKKGPNEVNKESKTMFEALFNKSSILRKPKYPLLPRSQETLFIPNHANLPYTYFKRNVVQKKNWANEGGANVFDKI